MPRRNRPKPDTTSPIRSTASTSPLPAPAGWQASLHKGGGAGKEYVCPRCRRPVPGSAAHVVAWESSGRREPVVGELVEEIRRGRPPTDRNRPDAAGRHRHWHSECWRAAVREGIDRYRFS